MPGPQDAPEDLFCVLADATICGFWLTCWIVEKSVLPIHHGFVVGDISDFAVFPKKKHKAGDSEKESREKGPIGKCVDGKNHHYYSNGGHRPRRPQVSGTQFRLLHFRLTCEHNHVDSQPDDCERNVPNVCISVDIHVNTPI